MEPDFIKYIRNDKTVLEESPLESVAAQKQLKAFQHEGFWQCMDTKRDLDLLRKQWKKGSRKWLKG
jgi:glucose-1-phosphate cytidylyltransferase